ncbi:kinase-like domain-containing protein [Mycena capillaripes]|nr:kinase-like domain-containing protein [Mycena capillaripes]
MLVQRPDLLQRVLLFERRTHVSQMRVWLTVCLALDCGNFEDFNRQPPFPSFTRTTMFEFARIILSCVSSIVSHTDTVRCRFASASNRALDALVLVVVAGAVKRHSVSLPPVPTKTLPIWLPPTPASFIQYHPPLFLAFASGFIGFTTLVLVSATLLRLGFIQGISKKLSRGFGVFTHAAQRHMFLVFVALPLFFAGQTTRVYKLSQKAAPAIAIHVRSGKRRNGTHRQHLLILRLELSDAAIAAIIKAYSRLFCAAVAFLGDAFKAVGYPFLVDVAPQFPAAGVLLPRAPRPVPRFIPEATALPSSDALLDEPPVIPSCPQFWGSWSWKPITSMGIVSLVDPTQLRLAGSLGSGGFGDVVKVETVDGRTFAVKRIPKTSAEGSNIARDASKKTTVKVWRSVRSEILVHLRMADNPAFPNLFGALHDADHFYLIMTCGVETFLNIGMADRKTALSYGWQLASAVHALHQHGVVHLDIKPDNLVEDADGDLMLVDYGLAHVFGVDDEPQADGKEEYAEWLALRAAGDGRFPILWATEENPHWMEVQGGTPGYACPAAIRDEICSYGADLWAVGKMVELWLDQSKEAEEADDFAEIDEDFLQKLFSEKKGERFESWLEILSHPIWATALEFGDDDDDDESA